MDTRHISLLHGFIETLLRKFIPFPAQSRITALDDAARFNFSACGDARLTGIHFTGKSWDSYLFFITAGASLPRWLSSQRRDRQGKMILEAFQYYGLQAGKLEWIDGGRKNLSAPGALWRREKYMITLDDGEETAFCVLPASLLGEMLRGAGIGWSGEIASLPCEPLPEFNETALSVLHSRQSLYIDFIQALKLLGSEKGHRLFLGSISGGYVDAEHLASLFELFPRSRFIAAFLPEQMRGEVVSLESRVKEELQDEALRHRWSLQLYYYLQNVMSRAVSGEGAEDVLGALESEARDVMATGITALRNKMREDKLPLSELMKRAIANHQVTELISTRGKDLLALMGASGKGELPLGDLARLFGAPFREELRFKIDERGRYLEALGAEKRRAVVEKARRGLRSILESEITGDLRARMAPPGPRELYERCLRWNDEDLLVLFNRLGFETFTAFFEILRYNTSSPLSEDEAVSLFFEKVKGLPGTERSISEDIFSCSLNWNRVITEEGLERHLRVLQIRVPLLERLLYIGGGAS